MAVLPDATERVLEASITPDKVETGMSFFITKAQKAALRLLGYSEEQIREMKQSWFTFSMARRPWK
jgi:hypothetical protein